MTIRFNSDLRNDVLSEYARRFSNGQLRIYSSTLPLSVEDPVGGELLAVCELPDDPFTTPTNGVMSKNGIWVGEIIATNTAGWFRIFSQDFNSWLDGTVTATGGGGDLEVDDVAFVSGNVLLVDSITISQVAYSVPPVSGNLTATEPQDILSASYV